MKKLIVLSMVGVLMLSIGVIAFADGNELPNWYNDMIKWRQERLNDAIKDGSISESEAEEWNEHYEDMREYHEENGFPVQGGGFNSGCPGGGFRRGFGPRGNSGNFQPGNGFGPGMMRGFNN